MPKKPVYDVTPETMWEYEYNALSGGGHVLASDSLNNLKKEIKAREWVCAFIQAREGCFSYGQDVVTAYPYYPRYF